MARHRRAFPPVRAAALLALVLSGIACGAPSDRPTLIVGPGENSAGGDPGLTGDIDVPLLQIHLRAMDASVTVSSIRFHAAGSGDDFSDLAAVRLYEDPNGDGGLDGGDRLLAAAAGYDSDDGDLFFTGIDEKVRIGRPQDWLLVYDIARGRSAGETFCAGILDESDVVARSEGKEAHVRVDDGVTGCLTASAGSLTIGLGPQSPPSRTLTQCAVGAVALQFRMEAGPREDVRVESVRVTAFGTGDDAASISGVWLYADENGDGSLDVSDTPLAGPAAYQQDDGRIVFSGLDRVIPVSTAEVWILVYNVGGGISPGTTFGARIETDGDVGATGIDSGQAAAVAGAPVVGSEFVIWGAVLQSATYEDVNANGVLDGEDTVTIAFSDEVVVQGSVYPHEVFAVDPPGGLGYDLYAEPGAPNRVVIPVGGAFEPNGTYGTNPFSSGVNVRLGQTGLTDCVGRPVERVAIPVDIEGVVNPRVVSATFVDENSNCMADQGDTLDVAFTRNVTLTTSDPDLVFDLPVAGDSFGIGAQVQGGVPPSDVETVTIVLGAGPTLTVLGIHDPASLLPGDPSGLDLGPTPGLVEDARHPGIPSLPNAQPGRDITSVATWMAALDGYFRSNVADSVASAGDVNGDGYADVIAGGSYSRASEPPMGKVYLYLGGSNGLPGTPDWTSSGDEQMDSRFGGSVASAGDVNGDGFSDVIVGAQDFRTTGDGAGKAYLYLGGPGGLSANPAWTSVGDDVPGARFGFSVASAGDVNGDGYSDVIIGAPLYVTGGPRGKVFVYAGGPGGLSPAPIWTDIGKDRWGFGHSVAGAGDVDADGFDDIIVGAPFETSTGKAYLYLGGPGGPSPTPAWSSTGQELPDSHFGWAVAPAGDVDGDRYPDVIVGGPGIGISGGYGRAYLFRGGPGGLSSSPSWIVWTLAEYHTSSVGWSVAGAGDLDQDGFADVIVTDPYEQGYDGQYGQGRAWIYLGGPAGLSPEPVWSSWAASLGLGEFGYSAASAGDVNGDGYPEVVVAARQTGVFLGFCFGQ